MLASTQELHEKISELASRVRQLEDALAIIQSSISPEPHPLLRDELLGIKFGLEHNIVNEIATLAPKTDLIDAFGTLTMTGTGEARFYGRSAGSEVNRMHVYSRPNPQISCRT